MIGRTLDEVRKHGWPRQTRSYRKKPRAVYAVQWNPRAKYWPPSCYQRGYKSYVQTANGDVEIQEGTWICWQRIKGKLDVWPVTPNIFAATYELDLPNA
jgi:hypothetical protein